MMVATILKISPACSGKLSAREKKNQWFFQSGQAENARKLYERPGYSPSY
jgi:hypothetical protein